jgi:hypothetical protein
MQKLKVFISSVQGEFAGDRKELARYIRQDQLLGTFFDPFLFEEVPATTHSPGTVYISEESSERYGTGTVEMFDLMTARELDPPLYSMEEGFKITIRRPAAAAIDDTDHVTGQPTDQVTDQVTDHDTAHDTAHVIDHVTGQPTGEATGEPAEEIKRVIIVLQGELKRIEIQELLQLRHQEYFRDNYLIPAIENGYIEMTIPATPNHPNQRYRLTAKGLEVKKKLTKKP